MYCTVCGTKLENTDKTVFSHYDQETGVKCYWVYYRCPKTPKGISGFFSKHSDLRRVEVKQ